MHGCDPDTPEGGWRYPLPRTDTNNLAPPPRPACTRLDMFTCTKGAPYLHRAGNLPKFKSSKSRQSSCCGGGAAPPSSCSPLADVPLLSPVFQNLSCCRTDVFFSATTFQRFCVPGAGAWTVASSADRAAAESGVAGLGSEAMATLCVEWLNPFPAAEK